MNLKERTIRWLLRRYIRDYHYTKQRSKELLKASFESFNDTLKDHPEYSKSKLDTYFYLSYSKRFLGKWIDEINKLEK